MKHFAFIYMGDGYYNVIADGRLLAEYMTENEIYDLRELIREEKARETARRETRRRKAALCIVTTLLCVAALLAFCTISSVAVEPIAPPINTDGLHTPKPSFEISVDEAEATALAKMAWGEARGCGDMEIAATMWCVLNRADAWGQEALDVITAPGQFVGYSESHPLGGHLYELAVDVLTRHQMEQQGAAVELVGRVLPKEYLWFTGDGVKNTFRDAYKGGNAWEWDCVNPYELEDKDA